MNTFLLLAIGKKKHRTKAVQCIQYIVKHLLNKLKHAVAWIHQAEGRSAIGDSSTHACSENAAHGVIKFCVITKPQTFRALTIFIITM